MRVGQVCAVSRGRAGQRKWDSGIGMIWRLKAVWMEAPRGRDHDGRRDRGQTKPEVGALQEEWVKLRGEKRRGQKKRGMWECRDLMDLDVSPPGEGCQKKLESLSSRACGVCGRLEGEMLPDNPSSSPAYTYDATARKSRSQLDPESSCPPHLPYLWAKLGRSYGAGPPAALQKIPPLSLSTTKTLCIYILIILQPQNVCLIFYYIYLFRISMVLKIFRKVCYN
jgi:hypothetical protein